MVAPCAASERTLSASGTGVRPAMRLIITVCDTPGSVYSARSAAAAALSELTPGTTRYSRPRASSASICSRIAPYMDGSPVCSRTTTLSGPSPRSNASSTCSSVMCALSSISQSARHTLSSAGFTSEPAYITMSARRSSS